MTNHYLPKRLYVSSGLEFQPDLCLHMNFSLLEHWLIRQLSARTQMVLVKMDLWLKKGRNAWFFCFFF